MFPVLASNNAVPPSCSRCDGPLWPMKNDRYPLAPRAPPLSHAGADGAPLASDLTIFNPSPVPTTALARVALDIVSSAASTVTCPPAEAVPPTAASTSLVNRAKARPTPTEPSS